MSFNVTSYADLKKVGTGVDGWTLDADYIQTADIDASASATENPNGSGGYYGFVPIGSGSNAFTGSYDGQGYKISNLYINRPSTDYVGLFGYVGSTGNITSFALEDASITGGWYVGGICSYNKGTIMNCYSTGSASGANYIGDFCGTNDGTIANCYSTGSVSGTNYYTGDFCGYNTGTIANCYSTGSVSGNSNVGGFCGTNDGTIANCYSTGSVSGNSNVGGFCGDNAYMIGIIISCYWDTQTSGQTTSDGGTGLNTADMVYPYSSSAYVNWDFVNIWKHDADFLINNGYPILIVFYPNYVLTYPATGVTHNEAILRGKAITYGSANIKAYFEYKKSTATSWTETTKFDIASTQEYQTLITGLDEGTLYDYRAVLEENGLPISYGSTLEFTTEMQSATHDVLSIATPLSLKVTKEINGSWYANMTILPDDYIQTESYVDIEGEEYVVKKINKTLSGGKYLFDVLLYHNAIEELSNQTIDRFDKLDTVSNLLTMLLAGSGWSKGEVDIGETVFLKADKRVSILEALTDLAELTGGEIDFHSKDRIVDLKRSIGNATGLQLRCDKNLTEIQREEDSTGLITRIYPYDSDNNTINTTVLDPCEDETLWAASGSGTITASNTLKKYKSVGLKINSSTLNETFIHNLGGNTIDLSGHDLLKFWIYSDTDNSAGLTFGIGESAYSEITVNTGALSAKSWYDVTLNLSSVADASKNAIKYLGFKNLSSSAIEVVFDYIRAFNGDTFIDSPNADYYRIKKEYVYQHSSKPEKVQFEKIIYPNADATVSQEYPNANYGSSTTLLFKALTSYNWLPHIKFSLADIPNEAMIISAVLYLYCTGLYGFGGVNPGDSVNSFLITSDWDENTITYNNKPSADVNNIHTFDMTSEGWKDSGNDFTAVVQDWLSGVADNYGIKLAGTTFNQNKGASIYSKESLINASYLKIIYSLDTDPEPVIKASALEKLYSSDEPQLKYTVKASDLSKVIVDTWEEETIGLGDTCKIYDHIIRDSQGKPLNVSVRVKKITRDILNPSNIDIELVNKTYNFIDSNAKIARQLSYAMPFENNHKIINANAIQEGYIGSSVNV